MLNVFTLFNVTISNIPIYSDKGSKEEIWLWMTNKGKLVTLLLSSYKQGKVYYIIHIITILPKKLH